MTETFGFANAAAALGIGLLVGLERERHKGEGEHRDFAGLRTFAITALLGYVTLHVGGAVLLGLIAVCLGLLITAAYWKSRNEDPGITSEVALLAVLVLGALCDGTRELAVSIAVVMTALLSCREQLHRFVRSQLSELEIRDALVLLIAALVVLPLAPDRFIGPYDAINLRTICTLTVLLMAVGAVGHIAVRVLGSHYGYALGAIASGFASSTVTIAVMGQISTREPANTKLLSAAAILSNVATVTQIALILGTVDIDLLRLMAWPLLAGFIATAGYAACLMLPGAPTRNNEPIKVGGAFNLKLALGMALTLTGITFVSSAMLSHFGQLGVMLTAVFSGFADAHASTASVAALAKAGQLPFDKVVIPVLIAVSTNSLSKCVVAWVSGVRGYAAYVIPGQLLLTAAMWAGMALN